MFLIKCPNIIAQIQITKALAYIMLLGMEN